MAMLQQLNDLLFKFYGIYGCWVINEEVLLYLVRLLVVAVFVLVYFLKVLPP
jgi:hypothetical protein